MTTIPATMAAVLLIGRGGFENHVYRTGSRLRRPGEALIRVAAGLADHITTTIPDRTTAMSIRTMRTRALPALLVLLAVLPGNTVAAESGNEPDVGYITTPPRVVKAMLELAGVGADDIVYDLGSGDGRIPIAAVRDFGARKAVGIEIDSDLVARSRDKARQADVAARTRFIEGDIFKTDFSEASVVTLYLFPQINRELRPRILTGLEPGTRVVSHEFGMGQWQPDQHRTVGESRILLWRVPAEVSGRWRWHAGGNEYRAILRQRFQEVLGEIRVDGKRSLIRDGRLRGRDLSIETTLPGVSGTITLEGRVVGDRIRGQVTVDGETHDLDAVRVD